jgi:hypothetical protein
MWEQLFRRPYRPFSGDELWLGFAFCCLVVLTGFLIRQLTRELDGTHW